MPPQPPAPVSQVGSRPDGRGRARALWQRIRVLVRLRRLYFLRAELRFAPTEAQRLFALTVAIGVLCGLVAVAFHGSIGLLERNLMNRAIEAPGRLWMRWTISV
ncbi:MAG TPA: hypothetical protein VGI10_18135, partial [Polyangiaceae bacterium]